MSLGTSRVAFFSVGAAARPSGCFSAAPACAYVALDGGRGGIADHVGWLGYKNVSSGPLDRETNYLEGERTSPDAVSPWALKTAKTDARCLPQGAPPTSPSTVTDMTKKRDSGAEHTTSARIASRGTQTQ